MNRNGNFLYSTSHNTAHTPANIFYIFSLVSADESAIDSLGRPNSDNGMKNYTQMYECCSTVLDMNGDIFRVVAKVDERRRPRSEEWERNGAAIGTDEWRWMNIVVMPTDLIKWQFDEYLRVHNVILISSQINTLNESDTWRAFNFDFVHWKTIMWRSRPIPQGLLSCQPFWHSHKGQLQMLAEEKNVIIHQLHASHFSNEMNNNH